ncbi:O-antigen ligase family protein [Candidatus Thioglobus sp.]|nr:O-antigen ligase family protein [Candidatus Thioglobus sp.]
MLGSFNLDKTYQILLITLAFLMPLTVFGGNLVVVIICLLWIFSGGYKSKIHEIINNKLMIASIAFFTLHVIGLAWTEDLNWGLHIVHKMWYFIGLFPILFTIVKKDYIKYYVAAFLLAIAVTEIFSYLVWFEVIPQFKNATVRNPTPFMSHISYNPILAFAIYLVLHEVFFNNDLGKSKFFLYSFFAITMIFNMFITGGRAGQVMFFAMLLVLIFQFFNYEKIKSLFFTLILIPGIFFIAYQSSQLFEVRVNSAINDIVTYEVQSNTSVGKRINYMLNSWDIIKKNPLIGVGTGDFPSEFKQNSITNINREYTTSTNPHNMYNLVFVQLGLVGIISFLLIFYYQIKQSFSSSSRFIRDVGITMPLLFLVIMFADSYLLGHYTTLMYVFFSSFLYKDFEKSK